MGPLLALMLHCVREMLYLSNDTSSHSSGNGAAEKNSIGSGSGRSDLTDPKNRPVMALADGAAEEEKGKGEEEKNLTDDVCSRSFKLSPTIPRGMGGSALPPLPPQSYETIPTLTLPYYAEVEPMAPTNDETSPAPSPNGASTAWVRSSQRTSISNVLYDIVAEGDTNEAPSSTTAWVRSSDRASISNVLFDIAGGGADERPPSPFAAAATLVRVKVRQSSVTSVIAAAEDSLPPTPVEAAHVHVEVAHRSRQQGLLAWAPDGRRCQLEALGPLFEEYRTSSPLTATFFLALVLRWVGGDRGGREQGGGGGGGEGQNIHQGGVLVHEGCMCSREDVEGPSLLSCIPICLDECLSSSRLMNAFLPPDSSSHQSGRSQCAHAFPLHSYFITLPPSPSAPAARWPAASSSACTCFPA